MTLVPEGEVVICPGSELNITCTTNTSIILIWEIYRRGEKFQQIYKGEDDLSETVNNGTVTLRLISVSDNEYVSVATFSGPPSLSGTEFLCFDNQNQLTMSRTILTVSGR